MKKYLLAASLLINILLALWIVKIKVTTYRFEHLQPKDLSYIAIKSVLFNALDIPAGSIVFIGDSHTDFFPMDIFFNKKVIKEGIVGNSTSGVMSRLTKIINSKPQKIFINIGVNDLLGGGDPNNVNKGIIQIINKLKAETPLTRLYLFTIFPSKRFIDRTNTSVINNIISLNKLLNTEAKPDNFTIIDLYTPLYKNGGLNPKYDIGDNVHLNIEGYKIWVSILNKYI